MVVAEIGGSWAGWDGDDTAVAGIVEEDLDDCQSVHNWTEPPALVVPKILLEVLQELP
jgi:hypothetical protein